MATSPYKLSDMFLPLQERSKILEQLRETERIYLQQQKAYAAEQMKLEKQPTVGQKWRKMWGDRKEARRVLDEFNRAVPTGADARKSLAKCGCEFCLALIDFMDDEAQLEMQQGNFTEPGKSYRFQYGTYTLKKDEHIIVVDILERLLRIQRAGRKPKAIYMTNSQFESFSEKTSGVWYNTPMGKVEMFGVPVLWLALEIPYTVMDDQDVEW